MRPKTWFMLLSFSIFTGATFNLAKYTVNYFTPYSAAAWRFGIAAVIMIIFVLGKEKANNKAALVQNGWMYAVLGFIGIFGFNALFFMGMRETSPVNGALIMATNPLITTLLSAIVLKTPMTKRQGLGIGCSLAGVILVLTQGSWYMVSRLAFSIGDIGILLGNFCWALYGVWGRRFLRQSSSLQTTSFTMVIGAIILILFAVVTPNQHQVAAAPLAAWGAIVFMAVFTTVLGYLFWNEGMKEIGAAKTSVFFNLVPVVTMLITALSGAAISTVQIIGAALVILGVALSSGLQLTRKVRSVGV
ncbi:DMT family transporter [Paenibacillus aestuarii]|uniref:DMT family transporter n=1 Tax=Paenibacillus aestuarii TaxID=516965 RepID=A0ABW0KDR7_9BACL|nr:EamA family transporter [Paenibacillus aestuarii]